MPVPKRASFRVTKDEWRRNQPYPECDLAGFLPALQADVFELRKSEHKRADQNRIPHDGLIALLLGEPGRKPDQHANQHAGPIFPRAMDCEEPNA